MRVSYFGYYLRHKKTGKKYLFDLRPFLQSFCNGASVALKNRVMQGDEHLYIFHQNGNLFLLVKTRSHEIIKRVNTKKLDLGEIYDVLDREDSLGFASYAYFGKYYFGFASTLLAPRVTLLTYLTNQIIDMVKLDRYEFCIEAFLHQATKDEVLRLPFLGRTVIELAKENPLWQDAVNFMNVSGEDTVNISSFELIIKPKKKKNIDRAIKKLITHTTDEGLAKFTVRAKAELDGVMTDLYLAGMSNISDSIKKRDTQGIADSFAARIAENDLLQKKVAEFNVHEDFQEAELKDLVRFGDTSSWSASLGNLQ